MAFDDGSEFAFASLPLLLTATADADADADAGGAGTYAGRGPGTGLAEVALDPLLTGASAGAVLVGMGYPEAGRVTGPLIGTLAEDTLG